MKVSKLVELLKTENQDAEVLAYLGAKDGWEMVELGIGDAIIGRQRVGKKIHGANEFVLIPIQVPNELIPWDDANVSVPIES